MFLDLFLGLLTDLSLLWSHGSDCGWFLHSHPRLVPLLLQDPRFDLLDSFGVAALKGCGDEEGIRVKCD